MIKTIVEERTDEQGRKVRVTRKIRLKLVTEAVEPDVALRRAWKKFGLAANDGPGPNVTSTIIGDPVFLKLSMDEDLDKQEATQQVPVVEVKSVKCRYCEGPHWSVRCPHKEKFMGEKLSIAGITPSSAASSPIDEKTGKYITPRQRKALEAAASGVPLSPSASDSSSFADEREQGTTVRISNLSDVVVDDDIRDLCSRIAPVSRCNVGKDRITGRCRGFAFVNFFDKESAEKVANRLNGLPYGNLILKAEIARPNEK